MVEERGRGSCARERKKKSSFAGVPERSYRNDLKAETMGLVSGPDPPWMLILSR